MWIFPRNSLTRYHNVNCQQTTLQLSWSFCSPDSWIFSLFIRGFSSRGLVAASVTNLEDVVALRRAGAG